MKTAGLSADRLITQWETDPAGKNADDVRPIRDEIDRRVRELLTELVPATTM